MLVSTFSLVSGYIPDDNNGQVSENNIKSADVSNATKRMIVITDTNVTDESLGAGISSSDIKKEFKNFHGFVAELNDGQIKSLKTNKGVKGVYEDLKVNALLSESVPQIKANLVHSQGITGIGSKVCIVDTGVSDSGPNLNPLIAEYDFVNSDNDATDDQGHGTHVAGIVASKNLTYRGVAPGASLMAAKVLDSGGSGYSSNVISGIEWCVANGADIISMSLGGGLYSGACDFEPMAAAGNWAVDQGVVVFAASGNSGNTSMMLAPSCGSKIISVGSVSKSDSRSSFSNGGPNLDVVAPGSSITSTVPTGSCSLCSSTGFKSLSGTSMATPHASGTAALLLEANPSLTPSDIRTLLHNTAVDLGTSGRDNLFGYGRIDANSAFITLKPIKNNPPIATNDSYSIKSDSVLAVAAINGVLKNDSDPEKDVLSSLLVSTTQNGLLTLNSDGGFTYTPKNKFTGTDSFNYKAYDGINESNIATVSITIVSSDLPSGQIFSDDFSSGFAKWTESGEGDWNTEVPAEKQVPLHTANVIAHSDDCDTSCTIMMATPVDLRGYASANMTFWRYADNDLDAGEYLKVELYDGTTWNTIFNWTDAAGDDDTWHKENINLASYIGASNFNVRFVTHQSAYFEEVEIDDIAIEGSSLAPANKSPIANAGSDKTVTDIDNNSESVIINGTSSYDPDGAITSYEWKEGSAILGNTSIISPILLVGTHIITLTVTDNVGATSSDIVTIIVNSVPIANAGSDKTVTDIDNNNSESVIINGTSSYDPDGVITSYEWKEGSAILGNTSIISPILLVGTHIITLTVTDNVGATSSDIVTIIVNSASNSHIFSDDFSSGFAKWTESGEGDWNTEVPAEKQVPLHTANVIAHSDDCDTSCTITMATPVDLRGHASATLTFWRYADNDLDAGEYLKVELFDGTTWNTIFNWTDAAGDDDTWHQENINLASYLGASNFNVRFVTHQSAYFEEVEIDDVSIDGIH